MAENNDFEDKSVDFYDEFKERMRQEPLKSVLEKRTGRSSRPVGGIVTVLVCVFAAAAILFFVMEKFIQQGSDDADAPIPVIQAENTPVKERPEAAGGMEIVGKDKSVYARIGRTAPAQPEKLLQKAEPVTPVKVEELEQPMVMEVKAPEPTPKIEEKVAEMEPSMPQAIIKIARVTDEKAGTEEKAEKIVPVYKPKVEEAQPVEPIKSVNNPPAPVAKDDWKVQVLSSRQKDGVESAWNSMKAKNPEIFDDVPFDIMEADLGEKGIFYRLRVGSFASRSDADALCKKLKDAKYDCIVVK